MKSISRTLIIMLVIMLMQIIPISTTFVSANGLSVNIKPSLSKPAVGQTITITVSISAKISLVNYDLVVSYDPNSFTYVKNTDNENLTPALSSYGTHILSESSIRVVGYGGTQDSASSLFRLSFKVLKAGTAKFTVSDITVNDEYPASSSVSVTVTDPLPGVNTLKSLDVDPGSISPAFSADHTSYAMSVAEGVGKVTVSATPSDSAAKVSVSGNTDLKDGENKISIVVTAQNGSKKTYTIIATRAGPSPTPMPSPTPEATPTPAVTIDVGGAGFAIIEAPADKPVPEGFYGSLAEINGQMVPAYKSLKGDLTLFYLSNQTAADGFYYYDKEASKYLPYTVLSLPAQTFSVLKPDAATVIPAGWQETTLKINNQDLPAWQQADTDGQSAAGDVYLLYLMNSQGNKDFYLYDTESQLLSFYAMTSFTTGTEETTTSSEEPTLSPTPAAADTTADTTKPNFWTLATAVLGLLCLVLTGLLIWQNVKANRRDDDNPDDDDFEPPEPPPIRRVD